MWARAPVRMIIELLDGSRALLDVDGQKVKWSGESLDEIEGLLGAEQSVCRLLFLVVGKTVAILKSDEHSTRPEFAD